MSAPLGAFLPFWTQLMNLVARTRKSSSPSVIGRRTRMDRLLSDFFVLSKRYRLLSQRRMWLTPINLEPAVDVITSQTGVNLARELSPSCVLALWLSVPALLVSRRDSLFVFLLKFKINVWMKVVASLRSSKRKHVSKRLQSPIFLFEKRIVLWLDHQQFFNENPPPPPPPPSTYISEALAIEPRERDVLHLVSRTGFLWKASSTSESVSENY